MIRAMEDLKTRHHKEQDELQSRITQKKRNATKKTRRGINEQCDLLQRQLQERQSDELDALTHASLIGGVHRLDIVDEDGEKVSETRVARDSHVQMTKGLPQEFTMPTCNGVSAHLKKPNRQKARLARRAADQERNVAQAEKEAAILPDLRQRELKAMQMQIEKLDLREVSVNPDGHCLYSAIALQLPSHYFDKSVEEGKTPVRPYQVLRNSAGDYMSNHADDFSAFMEEPLERYVSKVKKTAEWGGQLELQALARAYHVNINVLEANGRVEMIEAGEGDKQIKDLWLAYYRHSFGLGEHYNALRKPG